MIASAVGLVLATPTGFVTIDTREELAKTFAPVTSEKEAAAFAVTTTGAAWVESASFGRSESQPDGDGWRVRLFNHQVCGCSHPDVVDRLRRHATRRRHGDHAESRLRRSENARPLRRLISPVRPRVARNVAAACFLGHFPCFTRFGSCTRGVVRTILLVIAACASSACALLTSLDDLRGGGGGGDASDGASSENAPANDAALEAEVDAPPPPCGAPGETCCKAPLAPCEDGLTCSANACMVSDALSASTRRSRTDSSPRS